MIIFTFLILLSSCSFSEGPIEIFSRPSGKKDKSYGHLIKIPIFTSHGLHGHLESHREFAPKDSPKAHPSYFDIGGIKAISSYLHIIKNHYHNNVLIFESGSLMGEREFQSDKILKELSSLPIDAFLFTSFDFIARSHARKEWDQIKLPLINSNILDLKKQKRLEMPNLSPTKIFDIKGVKIGVIGLNDHNNLPQHMRNKISGIYFNDLVASYLRSKEELNKKGANIIILLINLPTKCKGSQSFEQRSYNNIEPLKCPSKDPLKEFVERIPTGSIDLIIVSSQENEKNGSGKIKDTLIIHEEGEGKYLSQTDLHYSIKNKMIEKRYSVIHPKLKLCHLFYTRTKDCYFEISDSNIRKKRLNLLKQNGFSLAPAKFLGFEIIDK